jgi:hypothetical protein
MLVVSLLGSLLAALAPVFVSTDQSLSAGAPAVVVELRGSQLKGTPTQLTWSPDGKMLCLVTLEGDTNSKTHAYAITIGSRAFQGLDAAPDWAAKYWDWKSARTPPGRRELVIQVETSTKPGSVPTQSLRDKAKGGMMENAVAAQNEAGAVTRTLTLKGEAIGTYVNQPLVPGMTFGWSPESLHAVAFAKPDGHLALLDFDAGRIEIENTKAVLLPAWSPDGTTIAYLQKTGRRDYVLSTVTVTKP